MGADKLVKNTPMPKKIIWPNCLSKPKSLVFRWKKVFIGVRSPCFKTMQSQHSQPVTMSTSLRSKSFGFLENEVHTCILRFIYFCSTKVYVKGVFEWWIRSILVFEHNSKLIIQLRLWIALIKTINTSSKHYHLLPISILVVTALLSTVMKHKQATMNFG